MFIGVGVVVFIGVTIVEVVFDDVCEEVIFDDVFEEVLFDDVDLTSEGCTGLLVGEHCLCCDRALILRWCMKCRGTVVACTIENSTNREKPNAKDTIVPRLRGTEKKRPWRLYRRGEK